MSIQWILDGRYLYIAAENGDDRFLWIIGYDSENKRYRRLTFTNAGVIKAPRDPYGGRYPAGSLHYNGVWYYGSYLTTNEGGSTAPTVTTADGEFNWGVLGPFMGFHVSIDNGQTWTQTPWTPLNPMFEKQTSANGWHSPASQHLLSSQVFVATKTSFLMHAS